MRKIMKATLREGSFVGGKRNSSSFRLPNLDDDDSMFKYGDQVTITIEHGKGIVARIEDYLKALDCLENKAKEAGASLSYNLLHSFSHTLRRLLETYEE